MSHHRARFTARGRWEVARRVIEKVRRSPRRPPGRTSRGRRSGGGAPLASATPGGPCVAGVPGRAFQPPPRSPARCRAQRSPVSVSCASGPGEPAAPRRRARGRTVGVDGASRASARRLLASPGARAPGDHPLRVAVPGPTCCTWTSRGSAGSPSPATGMTGDRTQRSAGSAGSTCTRSSMTARGWPTPRSMTTSAPRPSPPLPTGRWTGSSATGSSPSA